MTENEKIELFDKWYDENYDEWAEGEEGIALREELEQAFKSGISIIEKENAELKEELKTAYRKGMRHMAKALKDYDRTDGAWTDYFEHTVDKVLQREQLEFEEYGTLAEQLTKAKEIIKIFLKYEICTLNIKDELADNIAKAKAFLNSEVEK